MAKQRFRDVKKGKVTPSQKSKKNSESSSLPFATNFQKTKAAITDSFMLLMPIMYIVFYLVMGGREGFAEDKLMGWNIYWFLLLSYKLYLCTMAMVKLLGTKTII